jgi:glyoxylase-like metal-dependent hydrolase (beta-lactamase superfamily II)
MAASNGWVEIADRVFVRRYEFYDQNIGLILGRAEVAVIDTRSTYAQARQIQEHIHELTADPVGVVIDTHGHFDHVFGNGIFRPATIWGHERCVTFMVRNGEARKKTIAVEEPLLADELAEIVIDPPDRIFATHARIEVGGREVMLRYLGRGHTDHDVVVEIPGTDVIFAGDLLESGNVPFFGDAYPLDWPATATALAVRVKERTGVVVPGHGDRGDRAFADAQTASFQALAETAKRVEAGELPLEDAVATHPFPDYPPEDARRGFERALLQLRDELDVVPSPTTS